MEFVLKDANESGLLHLERRR